MPWSLNCSWAYSHPHYHSRRPFYLLIPFSNLSIWESECHKTRHYYLFSLVISACVLTICRILFYNKACHLWKGKEEPVGFNGIFATPLTVHWSSTFIAKMPILYLPKSKKILSVDQKTWPMNNSLQARSRYLEMGKRGEEERETRNGLKQRTLIT